MSELARMSYRPLAERDLAFVPLQCQGSAGEVRERVRASGSTAVLAFDGERCVGQLQFRAYVPGVRLPAGIHDPLYWMDYPAEASVPPDRSLSLFCYHVGQTENDPEQRDRRYQGRGIGSALLRHTLDWADAQPYDAVIAKAIAPCWPVMQYLGGMPWSVYQRHGFATVYQYHDAELRQVLDEILLGAYGARRLVELTDEVQQGADLDALAEVRICIRGTVRHG